VKSIPEFPRFTIPKLNDEFVRITRTWSLMETAIAHLSERPRHPRAFTNLLRSINDTIRRDGVTLEQIRSLQQTARLFARQFAEGIRNGHLICDVWYRD
jgi:hypothetical protein